MFEFGKGYTNSISAAADAAALFYVVLYALFIVFTTEAVKL